MLCHKLNDTQIFCVTFQSIFPINDTCSTCPVFVKDTILADTGYTGIGDRLKIAFINKGWTTSEACSCEQLRQELNTTQPAVILQNIDSWVERILPNVVNLEGVSGLIARVGTAIFPSISYAIVKDTLLECLPTE